MLQEILQKLQEIETQHNVRILYACESGSRAWGFPSLDSDYDVRFIYAYTTSHYLGIDDSKDIIEIPVNEILDINGWDIRKALRLFRSSNAALYEWIQSPVVYKSEAGFINDVKGLMPEYFSIKAGMHHYLSMARNAFSELQESEVKLKKYFYCIRSILAAMWILERQSLPPMEFTGLRALVNDMQWQETVNGLLLQKKDATEKTLISPVPLLQAFIAHNIAACDISAQSLPKKETDTEPLNQLFRKYINEF